MNALEDRIAALLAPLPRLPEGFRQGLARWSWVIALVAGILEAFGALDDLRAASALHGLYGSLYTLGTGISPLDLDLLGLLSLATAVIWLFAVASLRRLDWRGWRAIFLGTLIMLVGGVILDLVFLAIGGVIVVLIEVAIGWYFLFEIRPEFTEGGQPHQ
jgi:hypothetical protein